LIFSTQDLFFSTGACRSPLVIPRFLRKRYNDCGTCTFDKVIVVPFDYLLGKLALVRLGLRQLFFVKNRTMSEPPLGGEFGAV